jgi:hypothetical protein
VGEGVVYGVGDGYEVSGVATPLTVGSGRVQNRGFSLWDVSSRTIAVVTPSIGTTGGRVIIRADYSGATVRTAVKLSADGVAASPALTQVENTTWEISLATFTVTTGGVIALTDDRTFTKPVPRTQRLEVLIEAGTLAAGVMESDVIPIPIEYENLKVVMTGINVGGPAFHTIRIEANEEILFSDYSNVVTSIAFSDGASARALPSFGFATLEDSSLTIDGSFSAVYDFYNIRAISEVAGRLVTSNATNANRVFFGKHTYDIAEPIESLRFKKRTGNVLDTWNNSIYAIVDE